MRSENRVRDSLLKQLELLEPGLRLANKEVRIHNARGAAGRVDILARDSSDNLVVIEIKSDDQSARQALQELFKYAGLLRCSYGLPRHRIRCILVSTVWHELLVPFSEFMRVAEYDTRGFVIKTDSRGRVLSAELVQPLSGDIEELTFEKEHDFFLFTNKQQRARFLTALRRALGRYTFVEFVALAVDYCGDRANIFPCGVYLVMSKLSEDLTPRVLECVSPTHPIHRPNAYDDGPWTARGILAYDIRNALRDSYVDWDRGTPSKFVGVINNWRARKVLRVGTRVSNEVLYNEEELQRKIAQYDGENRECFQAFASPRHAQAWPQVTRALLKFLGGRCAWTAPLTAYLREVATNYPDAQVACNIFAPKNLMHVLDPRGRADDEREPFLELIVDSPSHIAVVYGILEWDGERMQLRPHEAFPDRPVGRADPGLPPPLPNVFAPRSEHAGDLVRHHLKESLLEFVGAPPHTVRRLESVAGALVRRPLERRILGISDFIARNPLYIEQLVAYLPNHLSLNPRVTRKRR